MSVYVYAIVSMGALGAIFAAGLTVASRVFAVEIDPRVEKVNEILPGANCGACGEAGCSSFAEAVVAGRVEMDACPPGGHELACQIAELLGKDGVGEKERVVAHVLCNGTLENAKDRSEYRGTQSCLASQELGGGHKACPYGCLGLGDCVRVCPFGAAEMGEDGIPRFDPEFCTGCGKCVEACPRNIVDMTGVSKRTHIRCSAQLPPKEVRNVCKVGCIGCRRCVKSCPEEAIFMDGKLARMDHEKCTHQGECVAVCPMKTIQLIQEEEWVST